MIKQDKQTKTHWHGQEQGGNQRERGWGEVEKGKGGQIYGDRGDLGGDNKMYRWCVIELYTWNLYNFISQCHSNVFNKI